MDNYISKGIICIKDDYNLEYRLCELTYSLNKDQSFEYLFVPNYDVIDLLSLSIFDGIPGLDLSLRKDEYVRKNTIPTFISERVPSESRVDYYELLAQRNMDYMDPIEYLIRSKKKYSGDNLYVIAYEEKTSTNINIDELKCNSIDCNRKILSEICKGNNVLVNGEIIDDTNRKSIFNILISIYGKSYRQKRIQQKNGINSAKKQGKYVGRTPVRIEKIKLLQMQEDVKNKKLTSKQAAEKLGISIHKYYRELKKLHN